MRIENQELRIENYRIKGKEWGISLCVIIFLFSFFSSTQAQIRIPSGASGSSGSFSSNNPRTTSSTSRNQQQGPRYGNDSISTSDTSATKGLVFHEETPDSVLRKKVFFFHYTPKEVKINELWNPVLDPTGIQFNDPLDGFNGNYYLGKGVVGHPHTEIYPFFANGLYHQLQADEMAGYVKTPESIRLYQTLTPYSVLSYNSSLKKDYRLHVAHTQNVKPGWNLSFDYQLMCPEGILSNSGAKDHFLDFTTNYFSPDSRLQVQAGFIWQSFTIDENGGLAYDSLFSENLMGNYSGLPVKLSNSGSTHLRHDVFGRITYNLVRQVAGTRERDSLVVKDSVLDTVVVIDTLPVSSPQVLNAGVFGAELRYHRHKRASYISGLGDSTLWSEASAILFWTNDAYPDYRWRNPLKITLGVTPRRLSATLRKDTLSAPDTLVTATAINPFVKAELLLWGSTLTLEGELDNSLLNLNSAIKKPDYHACAALAIPFDSTRLSGLEISAATQRQMPEIRMLLSTNFTMEPILSQSYGLHLYHSSDSGFVRLIDLDVHASQLENYAWYDSTLTVRVGNKSLWLAQAALTMRLAWNWLHLDMQHLFQHTTDNMQVDVPTWVCKNSLYGDFTLFGRALRLQVGTDVRYITSFCPDGYDPATGLFYWQEGEVGDYIWADVFLNLQIKRASIYVKAGHINALWENHPRYFLLPHYPGQKFGLFWGMTWHFFD